MNILVLTPTFLPIMGGAETGIYEICRHLAGRHRVRILTPEVTDQHTRDYGMEEAGFDLGDIEVIRFRDRLNIKNWPGQWRLQGLLPPFSLSQAIWTKREISRKRPDVILVFYALPCGLAGVRAQRTSGVPVVLSLIGRDVPGPDIPRFWGRYVRWVARSVSRTIFISEYCRQALFGDEPFPADVIPFGVDVSRYSPAADGSTLRRRLSIPEGAKVLFALQRLDIWKRVDVLIRSLPYVRKHVDACLVIGGKGPELEALRRLRNQLGLDSQVIFAGYIPEAELPQYYAMADLFVFHSTYETFGVVLLQAMAAAKPVVSVRSTAIPELIRHGENGLLVDPLDSEAFGRAAGELLCDEATRNRFATAARQSVFDRFGWTAVAQRYERVLMECTQQTVKGSNPDGGSYG